MAEGYCNLATVIDVQEGDFAKAESLVRESLRIRRLLYHENPFEMLLGTSTGLLASILQSQGNYGDKTRDLLERSLAIDIKNFGPEGINTASANSALGKFYYNRSRIIGYNYANKVQLRQEYLCVSELRYKDIYICVCI